MKAAQAKKSTQRTAGASLRSGSSRKRSVIPSRSNRRNVKTLSAKNAKTAAARPAPEISRARAAAPARATHGAAAPVNMSNANATARSSAAEARRRPRPEPVQSPISLRHVAPPRPVLLAPARSMPPAREIRKPLPAPVPRPPVVIPDFTEAGVLLAITYSIRDGRRNEFFDLMRELKPLLSAIGGLDCTVYEDRSRPNYFMEVFRFKDEAEFTAFDDKFHKDRKIAAIYALLDDIVEAEKSDFKIFERRL